MLEGGIILTPGSWNWKNIESMKTKADKIRLLEESINAHKENLSKEDPYSFSLGPHRCPLCKVFWRNPGGSGVVCTGCPIAEFTGQNACEDTPYYDLEDAFNSWANANLHGGETESLKSDFRKAEENEIAFLEEVRDSLR